MYKYFTCYFQGLDFDGGLSVSRPLEVSEKPKPLLNFYSTNGRFATKNLVTRESSGTSLDWWQRITTTESPNISSLTDCSTEEIFAPDCVIESHNDFQGCVEDKRYPYRAIYEAIQR